MSEMKFQDTTLSPKERASDLLSRLTIEQKIDQIGCVFTTNGVIPDMDDVAPNGIGHIGMLNGRASKEENIQFTKEIQDYVISHAPFGIPALIHSEALSGLMARDAEVFPVAIGLSCTWDPDTVRKMGDVIRKQMVSVGFRQALSPVLDISRDSRWGRIGETYGEDPCLSGAMAAAFVGGLQGNLNEGVAATTKHFVGYGIAEGGMNMAQVTTSERTLREVYCRPFQAAISESNLQCVMNSYGSFNNEPISTSHKILTEYLRENMGFEGIVVSDYLSIDRNITPFNVAKNEKEAGILSLKAGMDVEYPRPTGFSYELKKAIEDGELDENDLDRAAYGTLKLKFALGLFEHPYGLPEFLDSYGSDETIAISKKLANETPILLKNDGNVLPLSKDKKKIAVIGPHADSIRSIFGCYTFPASFEMNIASLLGEVELSGDATDGFISNVSLAGAGKYAPEHPLLQKKLREFYPGRKTIFEALKEVAPDCEFTTSQACDIASDDKSRFEEAINLAKDADVVILTLGGKNGWGPTCTIGEGIDSANIGLPGVQLDLAKEIASLNKTTVIIHTDGRALSEKYVVDTFPAILEAYQPGEYGGEAIAKIIFGDVNPSGKLSTTAAICAGQLPLYYGMLKSCGYPSVGQTGMIKNPNGYADVSASPLFCFGHGLSYTDFEYSNLSLSSKKIAGNEKITISVDIKNSGSRTGTEVVQIYMADLYSSMIRPVKELVGFGRVELIPGETKTAVFEMPMSQMAFLDSEMKWKVEAGDFDVLVGSASNDIRLKDSFEVTSDAYPIEKDRGFFAKFSIK